MEYEYLTNEKEGMILLIGNEPILRQSGGTKKQ